MFRRFQNYSHATVEKPLEKPLEEIIFNNHPRPPRFSIGFRNELQAYQYWSLISEKEFTKSNDLEPTLEGCFVSVRLPARLFGVEVGIGNNGFCLCTGERDFAQRWIDALILWTSSSSTVNKLYYVYVERDISDGELNRLLGIDEYVDQSESTEPGKAQTSEMDRRRFY
ncbi:hypothetical protein F4777DRAFT_579259 [Nemania sp. FL0916]|nr:hypothetical protein F4777DRAFT_579259 [Nemania sp. FL0916]